MLDRQSTAEPTFDFEAFRAEEFGRLDAAGIAYLDYTAGALYGASQARAHAARLTAGVFGNPHSEHLASRNSAEVVEAARAATLAFFDADPAVYEVCFTANATAAIKLVAESYPFTRDRGLVLTADNHNSVNGIREYARRASAPIAVLPLDAELRLDRGGEHLRAAVARRGAGLLALPQQSNFSGVRHDLVLVDIAQRLGCDVLIDAASAGACGGLSLRRYPAEFVACSFYKLFGLPTGVGALIGRKSALARLRRPWFAGGTVDFVSIAKDRHALRAGHQGFEDGTPNYLDLAALEAGFAFLERIPREALRARVVGLTQRFLDEAVELRHPNGAPKVRLYGQRDMDERGGTAAFNLLRDDGQVVAYEAVERAARDHGVAIRGGCFCNPGAAETAFGFDNERLAACVDALEGRFSIPALREGLDGAAVGALRLSVGAPTIDADLDRALSLLETFAGT
ncbi:MAG: aminotransferase class V-fold PLP-dependent enzyme [Alphaproteobacteria bacterium]|nr:aminotransferase class V-fold PLP-dependent enzyme [Alphaproteobacteria bacterium]